MNVESFAEGNLIIRIKYNSKIKRKILFGAKEFFTSWPSNTKKNSYKILLN